MAKVNPADIVARAQKLYGKDTKAAQILVTGEGLHRPTKPEDFIVAPAGHPWRDLTGLLGLPFGYIVQIAGAFDSGKSTCAGEFMAWAQAQGYYVILFDPEKKFDKVRFEKFFKGRAKELLIVEATTIRKGVGGMFKYIEATKELDPAAKFLLVHDSVGGSISRARAEHEFDSEKENQPGSEARENSDYMKAVLAYMDKYPDAISLLLINQMTDKIGFGQKGQSRSGGHKISFHSSLIVELKQIKELTKTVNKVEKKLGIITQAKVKKNHLMQGELSTSKMNIKVTADGWQATDFSFSKDDESKGGQEE